MSMTLSERALEIIESALFYGTITFGDKTTVLKPETVLNLAKSLSVKQKEVKDESVDMPVDFFPSLNTSSNIPNDLDEDLSQLSFPFMKHDGK